MRCLRHSSGIARKKFTPRVFLRCARVGRCMRTRNRYLIRRNSGPETKSRHLSAAPAGLPSWMWQADVSSPSRNPPASRVALRRARNARLPLKIPRHAPFAAALRKRSDATPERDCEHLRNWYTARRDARPLSYAALHRHSCRWPGQAHEVGSRQGAAALGAAAAPAIRDRHRTSAVTRRDSRRLRTWRRERAARVRRSACRVGATGRAAWHRSRRHAGAAVDP